MVGSRLYLHTFMRDGVAFKIAEQWLLISGNVLCQASLVLHFVFLNANWKSNLFFSIYFYLFTFNFLKYKFIYFNWRLITLQYCISFAIHQRESATGIQVFTCHFVGLTSQHCVSKTVHFSITNKWCCEMYLFQALCQALEITAERWLDLQLS